MPLASFTYRTERTDGWTTRTVFTDDPHGPVMSKDTDRSAYVLNYASDAVAEVARIKAREIRMAHDWALVIDASMRSKARVAARGQLATV